MAAGEMVFALGLIFSGVYIYALVLFEEWTDRIGLYLDID